MSLSLFRILLFVLQLLCLLLMCNSKDINYTVKTGVMALIVSMLIAGLKI